MQHNVIELSEFRKNLHNRHNSNLAANANDGLNSSLDVRLPQEEIERLETIRDSVECILDTATTRHCDPAAVSFAAGRFAAMRLFQLQGRAQTMAFFNQCIETLELAEDLFQN
ncbi:hypothetical protein OA101_00235 [Alphaproteobacteria bacterium]|nr:hypothetical protein [Alphaproteobacteria bacterium]